MDWCDRIARVRPGAWAVAAAVLLVGCGGGGEPPVEVARLDAPVTRVESRVQPADAVQDMVRTKALPADLKQLVPSRIVLDALLRVERPVQAIGGRLVGVARDLLPTKTGQETRKQLQWQRSAAGASVAALSFRAEGAYGLRLGVVVRSLPGGAVLRIYDPDRPAVAYVVSGQEVLQRIQANLDAGDRGDAARTWWSPDLGAPETTLEIELPAGTPPSALDIAVPRLSHILEDLSLPEAADQPQAKIGESQPCHLDATCYDAYAHQRDAVARMLFTIDGSSYRCTGTLLNDRDGSGTPYFLTANHCIPTQTVASTLQTDWFYRSPTCYSRQLSSASVTRYNGATLLYASADMDMAFMRLVDTPPAGVSFAGWDASPQVPGAAVVGLHHPRGDLQKISFGGLDGNTNCTAGTGTAINCSGNSGNFYRVKWSQGTTERGSSGSAIFKDNLVIATLYGGSAVCSTTSPDYYGRFDVAFNAALKRWLSPEVAATSGGRGPVYRFYNTNTGTHFYTHSVAERDVVNRDYPAFSYEGVAFYAHPSPAAGQNPVYRFYNAGTGAHFYTISNAEKDLVTASYPAFSYEGPQWYAQAQGGNGATALFRFYNVRTGVHFYTISALERDFVVANYPDFRYEGPAYHAWTTP